MRSLGTPTVDPELLGLVVARDGVVAFEDGDVELGGVDAAPVGRGEQLPGVGDGVALEVVAEGEVAEHLEEGVVAAGEADVLEVVVLAAGADAFLASGGAGVVARLAPRKTSLNWFMPALVKSSVGSLAGTSEEECTRRWPLPSKNRRNSSRIWLPDKLRISVKFSSDIGIYGVCGAGTDVL